MLTNRREFLGVTVAAVANSALIPSSIAATESGRLKIEAIADAFTIFDPRSVTTVAEGFFPGRVTELVNEWRTRQFEYTCSLADLAQYALR